MVEYLINVAMSQFTVTRNRRTGHPDNVYLYWNVQRRKFGFGIDNKPHPAIETTSARLHIPGIPLRAGDSIAPDLRTIRENFFDNPDNPFKDPLVVRMTAKSDEAITIAYVAHSLINERADPAARSRAFNNTMNEVDKWIGAGTFVANAFSLGWGAAIGGFLKAGLGLAKGINNFFDPPDAPQVDCSGLLAADSLVMKVEDLVAKLGSDPEATETISKESYQETPQPCSAHGALSTATFTFTIRPMPEFGPEDHDSANWKVSPVTGLPLSAWQGTWGETPSVTANRIECAIHYHPPTPPFVFPHLTVQVREKRGTSHYSVNLTQQVFGDSPAFVDTVAVGPTQALRRTADAIRLHDGATLYLYQARDRFNQFREYRIRYRRRNDAGALEVDRMLVRAYRVT